MKLGVLTSHPIQYQAPLFRALAREVNLKVFFAHQQSASQQAEAGFGVAFEWDVDLLSGYRSEFLANRAKSPNVFSPNGCDTPEIKEIIHSQKFDTFIVTGWYLKSYWQAIRACRRYGVPVLVRGDSQLGTPRSLLKQAAKELIYRWVMKQFDGFLYVGQRNLEYLLHYGAPRERCFFSPHFVDNDWFRERSLLTDEERRLVRAELGADDDQKLLLFVGRLVEMKRPADLLEAASMLKGQGFAVRPVFVGAGSIEPALREHARQLGVPATFAGFKNQSELPQIYSAADLLILPSESETWGLSVNEAMACGTPAIVSDIVGCAPDLIDEEWTGRSFACGNPQALADAVTAMLPKVGMQPCQEALQTKLATYSVANAVAGIRSAASFVIRGKVASHI